MLPSLTFIIIINSRSCSKYYYTILPTINHNVTDTLHLITTILTVTPLPLTTCNYNNKSVIKDHVIHNCLIQLNQLLQDVRSSLVKLSTSLTGCHDTIDDEQLQLLQFLLANRVPTCWHWPLNLPVSLTDLTDYLQIIQRMAMLMTKCLLQHPVMQCDITYLPSIAALLQQFKLHYCSANNVQAEQGSLICEVR